MSTDKLPEVESYLLRVMVEKHGFAAVLGTLAALATEIVMRRKSRRKQLSTRTPETGPDIQEL